MTDATFAPGSVIRNRDRLWRGDDLLKGFSEEEG